MKRRLLGFLAIAALLLAAGTIAVACGDEDGDEELTLDEYFHDVQGVWDDYQERATEADELFNEDPGNPEAARKGFTALADAYERALDEQGDLNPPPEAKAAHEEFLSAGQAVLAVTEGIADRIAGAESWSEVLEATDDFAEEGETTNERLLSACLALQAVADDNGVDADLGCQ